MLAVSACQAGYRFVEVRFPGAADTIATGVTDQGLVVGTYGPSIDVRRGTENGRRGFVHNPITGSYQTVNAFGSVATNVSSVNGAGQIVGDYFVGNRLRGFVYNTATGFYTDVFPDLPGAVEAVIGDIDDNGVLIGTYSTNTSLSAPNGNTLAVRGFRAIPQPTGGYDYQAFDFPFATGTFGGSRNVSGVEVGTAIEQSVFGDAVFGYSLLSGQQYEYPDQLTNSTQLTAVSNTNRVLGSATIVSVNGTEVTGRNESFLLQANPLGQLDEQSREVIALPCPTCRFTINLFTGVSSPMGRSVATNLSDGGLIVGFTDFGTPNLVGYIGVPTPGDFNLDGRVDAADYSVWRDSQGSVTLLLADENNNGVVDAPDYQAWSTSYGFGVPPSAAAAAAALPEGAALPMIVALGCAVSTSRLGR